MTWYQLGVETAATMAEVWILISVITEIAGSKYHKRVKNVRIMTSALVLTVFVSVLNSFHLFSFLNIILSMAMTFAATKLTAGRSTFLRLFATVLAYLCVHAMDYILLFTLGIIVENPISNTYSFNKFIDFGLYRCLYVFAAKAIDVILYFVLKKQFGKLRVLRKRYLLVLFVVVSAAYVVMSILLSLILSDSMVGMQLAIIFSWLFILLCVCITLCFSYYTAKYQEERSKNELLNTCNSMMEKNYQRLYMSRRETACLIHDFNHHVGALRELFRQKEYEEIGNYIESLSETHYKELPLCKSGNSVIDAIINCKIGEAQEYHIKFSYSINVEALPSLPPADLCSILANQIDNAFDACKEINDLSQRVTEVHIWQNSDNLYLFQVSNRVQTDPFVQNPQLHSTKPDSSCPHGLGLSSIRDTAEKYGGTLQNRCQNGKFYSTVFLNLDA